MAAVIDTIRKFGMHPTLKRDGLSIILSSALAKGYTRVLKDYIGFTYSAVGAMSRNSSIHYFLNSEEVIEKTENLLSSDFNNLGNLFLSLRYLASSFLIEANEKKDSPWDFLKFILRRYADYGACLGAYNCFYRYLGNEKCKGKLTPGLVEILSRDRTEIAEIYVKTEAILKQCAKSVGDEEGFDGDLLRFMTLDELKYYLEHRKLSSIKLEELGKRREKHTYFHTGSEEHVFTDESIVKQVEDYFSVGDVSSTTELKGVSAYPGKLRGTVCNMTGKREPGDNFILVTPMTMPDDMHLISKCSAIITDEGGMLSHAAIIAREMKKPCIIGTKIATQVFKTGDLVEVDADNGIVQKVKQEKIKLNPFDQYNYLGQWVAPTAAATFWMYWTHAPLAQKFAHSNFCGHVVIDGRHFRDKDGLFCEIKGKIAEELGGENIPALSYIFEASRLIEEEANQLINEYGSSVSINYLEKAFDLYERAVFPWSCFNAVNEAITDFCASNGLSELNIREAMNPKKTLLDIDNQELQKFKKEFERAGITATSAFEGIEEKHPELAKRLIDYQKETEYIGTHHLWGEPRSIEKLLAAIMAAAQEKDHTREPTLPSQTKNIADIAAQAAFWRLQLAMLTAKITYLLRPTLNKIAKENNLSYDELIYATHREIIQLAKKEAVLSKEDIKKRIPNYGIMLQGTELEIITGEEAQAMREHFNLCKEQSNVNVINGNPGNKGAVVGKVAIVKVVEDIKKVKPGMILVSPETTPDFISAMQKAAAFVTDQGGITSHAAIVARELGKPCIIGTKIATSALKDGDLVKVDADNGIITKLESRLITKTFKEITKDDAGIAGGKGASLGEMTKAGIPVPPGFVVLADAFEDFISSNNLREKIDEIIENLDSKDINQVQNASDEIKSLILNAEMHESTASEIKSSFRQLDTPYVAVRSSATAEDSSEAAWAGQLESYLNTTASTLLENVKKCWASLFTPRAIVYRFEKKLQKKKISVAVVVQKMVDSRASGIGFSVHPVTQDRNKIIIESGFGLGEAVVSGQITPDSYVVDKNSWENEKQVSGQKKSLTRDGWRELGEQGAGQVLTDQEITALARLIKKIETHYGFPVDVEFAIEKDDFFIVQSRPITTLSSEKPEKYEVIEKIKNLKWNKVVTRPETALFRSYTDHSNYFRFEQSTGISWRGPNAMSLKKTIYNRKDSGNELYEKIKAGYAKDPSFFAKLGARTREWMEKLLSIANSIAEKDPESMSHEQLREEYRKYDQIAKDTFAFLIVMASSDHVLSENIRAAVRSRISDESKAEEYFKILTFPEIENTHTKEMHSLLKIAAGLKQDNIPLGEIRESIHYEKLKTHLNKFRWIGARSFWDTEWTEEDLLQRLEVLLSANPEKEIEYLESIRKENTGNTKKLLGILQLDDNEKHLVDMAKDFAYLRTYRTDSMHNSGFSVRPLFNEIAKRFGITYREFAMMGCFEVLESLGKGELSVPKEVLRERVEEFATVFVDGKTHIFSGKPLARLKNELSYLFEEKKTGIIRGSSAYPGKVTGEVKVIHSHKDVYKVNLGDILVAPMTTPNYVPAMEKAAAFVTDEGGILCHAAIVAREMRKPCVTATDNASRLLEDGDIVEVDADTGVVRIQKSDYTYLWNDQHPLYALEGNLLSMKNNRDIIWNQIDNVIEISRKNMFYCYHSNKDLEKDVERGKKFFEKEYPEQLFAEIDNQCAEKWKFYDFIYNEDLSRYSDNQLFDLHKKFIFGWAAAIGNFRASQQEGTHYLIEELKKSFTDEEMTILMTPTVLDTANNEMIEWKEIVSNEYSEDVMLEHAKKYPWVVAEHFSYEDIFETLKQRYEFDRKNPNPHDFAAEKRKVREKQDEILKKDPSKKWISDLLQKLAVGRMQIKACWAGIDFYMINLIHEIAKRTGEHYTDVFKYCMIKDMEELINGKPLSAEEKERRDRCFVGLWKGGKIMYASGDEAEEIAKQELKEQYSIKKTDMIEGMPAHPGKATGKVRILPTNNVEKARELRQNFKKGEILMTGMTQPNIVDIASRAGAIVTNEGGMLSHAAIIAREFDIPCIVGTLTATRVFEDGEIVEVDANKGVVKIVEEKNGKQNY